MEYIYCLHKNANYLNNPSPIYHKKLELILNNCKFETCITNLFERSFYVMEFVTTTSDRTPIYRDGHHLLLILIFKTIYEKNMNTNAIQNKAITVNPYCSCAIPLSSRNWLG